MTKALVDQPKSHSELDSESVFMCGIERVFTRYKANQRTNGELSESVCVGEAEEE